MKKFLSFAFVSVLAIGTTAQTLWEDNFESYDVGQLQEQGGWVKVRGRDRFVLVQNIDEAHGKSMRLAATGHVGGMGHMHSHEIGWGNRDSGNNIFVFEYDLYNGTSANGLAEIEVYDTDPDEGVNIFDIYDVEGELKIYYKNFQEEAVLGPALDNTWYHIQAVYNYDNGQLKVSIDGGSPMTFQGEANVNPTGVAVHYRMTEDSGFDNFVAKAVNIDPFLATSEADLKSDISIFPNPVTDVISIKSGKEISIVSILDVSGKLIKQSKEKTINIENLAKGVYLVQINYLDGTKASKKIIKK